MTDNLQSTLEKLKSNNLKLDKVIFDLEKDIASLTSRKKRLNEEVSKLNEEVISVKNELIVVSEENAMLEDKIQKKTTDTTALAVEVEKLKWKKTWYSIVAENQSTELKVNYDRMNALSLRKKSIEISNSNKENSDEEENIEEVEKLKIDVTKLEQEIYFLTRTVPTQANIDKIEEETLRVKENNKTTINSLKAQLAQLECSNAQSSAYLKSLQKELQEK